MWVVSAWLIPRKSSNKGSFEAPRETDRPKKAMDYFSMPVDLQSTGYGKLMRSETGAQDYGVWCALLQIVASLPKEVRNGSLVNDKGKALTVEDISVKTRMPESIIQTTIKR